MAPLIANTLGLLFGWEVGRLSAWAGERFGSRVAGQFHMGAVTTTLLVIVLEPRAWPIITAALLGYIATAVSRTLKPNESPVVGE
ncbi:hypothetical protein [Nocardioides sp. InS609-2]|uniref:hypothetical protein n=1 Tax=Nocardioides sp. InS609-2 TaxID=2760705 RepID=UPI0020C133AA|nr:hypothetical protein [Nocardioides sp. InS609-2]